MGCHFGRPSKFLPPPLQFGAPLFGLQTMGPTFFPFLLPCVLTIPIPPAALRPAATRPPPHPRLRLRPAAPALAGRGATATQAVRSLPWQEAVRYLFLGYYRMNETDAAWFVLVCSGRQRIVGWRRKGIIGCIAV